MLENKKNSVTLFYKITPYFLKYSLTIPRLIPWAFSSNFIKAILAIENLNFMFVSIPHRYFFYESNMTRINYKKVALFLFLIGISSTQIRFFAPVYIYNRPKTKVSIPHRYFFY